MTAGGAAGVIGRESELRTIARLVETDGAGPRALLLEGEAGIGKTTLWQWGADRARDVGHLVLHCRPAEAEVGLPFAGLADLLDPFLDELASALAPTQRLPLETALAVVEPTAPVDRLAVSRAGLSALRSLAAERSLMLAVDDVQWLDPATAGVLEFAVRRLTDAQVSLLVTRRSDREAALPLGLDRALRPEAIEIVRVLPLSIRDLDRVLRARLELTLPRPRLVELHRITGGNPFYALEIARQAVIGDALTVPDSLAELLRRRLAEVSDAGGRAILLAAASSQPTLQTVERAAGGHEGLADAIDRAIVALDGERLRFTHPLLASVAYSSAAPWEQRAAHAALAEAAPDPEERALHLALATEQADETVATALDAAAERAYRRGAPAAAAELSDHACRLTPEDRPAELATRNARSAEYHLAAGDTDRGRELLEHLVASRPPGLERAELLLRLGNVGYLTEDVPAAHRLFEQALAEAGDDARLTAAVEQALAFTAMFGGSIPEAGVHAKASLQLAETVDDPGLLALALGRVALIDFLAGNGVDRARFEQAVALEKRVDEAPVEWLPSYAYAGVALFADDLDTARTLYTELYTSALERGDERAVGTLLFSLSQLESAVGNWGLAGRYGAEAVERSRQSGLAAVQANAIAAEAHVHALVGNVDAARALAGEGLRLARQAGAAAPLSWLTATLGFLELSVDNPAAAHELLGPLAQMIVAIGLAEPGVVRFLPDAIEALIALGELDAARESLLLLEERGLALDRISARGAAARCRALLEAALGNFDLARLSVEEALFQHRRVHQPFELGRTLLVQGTIERRAKRRRDARRTLTQALEIFDSLGAALWAEKAAAELARIPGRTRSSEELTDTERRVAELAAEGLANKEIAARLFVTVRTVEWNLSKVYGKLGVRSRTELASRLARSSDG